MSMAGKTVKQLYGNGTGQSFMDRVNAAKHSVTGSGLAKIVCKATTEEMAAPKKKHLEYLVQCTFEQNVSIPDLANLLIERTQQANWVVVFKSLISIHHLMNYGNERLFQYLASNNSQLSLSNFNDRTGIQAFDMSKFVRQYSRYVEQKSRSYRDMAFDFCKIKRGKDEGVMRKMSAEKLMKTIPILETQLDSMLDFDANGSEIHHSIVYAAFLLLYKDAIRLFATYNDGIINLIEKYFTMTKKQCRNALDCYKRFTQRMDRLNKFLKLAEDIGFGERNNLELQPVPPAVYEALENHLNVMEGKKPGESSSNTTSKTAPSNDSSNGEMNSSSIIGGLTEAERQRIIAEEQAKLEEYARKRSQNAAKVFSAMPEEYPEIKPSSTDASNQQLRNNMKQSATTNSFSPFNSNTTATSKETKASDDLVLLDLDPNPSSLSNTVQQPFQPNMTNSSGAPGYITKEAADIFGVSTTVILQQQHQQQQNPMFQMSQPQQPFNTNTTSSMQANGTGFSTGNNFGNPLEVNFEKAFAGHMNIKNNTSTAPATSSTTASHAPSVNSSAIPSSSIQPPSLEDKLASLVSSLDMSPGSKLATQPVVSVNWGTNNAGSTAPNKGGFDMNLSRNSNLTGAGMQWNNVNSNSGYMNGPNPGMNYGVSHNLTQMPMMQQPAYPPNMMSQPNQMQQQQPVNTNQQFYPFQPASQQFQQPFSPF